MLSAEQPKRTTQMQEISVEMLKYNMNRAMHEKYPEAFGDFGSKWTNAASIQALAASLHRSSGAPPILSAIRKSALPNLTFSPPPLPSPPAASSPDLTLVATTSLIHSIVGCVVCFSWSSSHMVTSFCGVICTLYR